MEWLSVSLCLLCLWSSVSGHSSGAPIEACVKDAIPDGHWVGGRRVPPQSLQSSPYNLSSSNVFYNPGEQIQVYLTGQRPFKGFFIQAYDLDPNDGSVIRSSGGFVEGTDNQAYSLIGCTATTHRDNKPKKSMAVTWQAPNRSGVVLFLATVVQDYTTFWVDLSNLSRKF